jgi:hypothetical protein
MDLHELPLALKTRYISVDRLNKQLKELSGVSVEIPISEIKRLEALMPQSITPTTLKKLELLKQSTEDNESPIITQIPAKILVNGIENDFTINTLKEVMLLVHKSNKTLKYLFTDNISTEILNKVWDSHIRAWSSACLKNSKAKSFVEQKELQEEVLGKESEIYGDMYLALLINYIVFNEDLIVTGNFMRLNSQEENGDSHQVYTSGMALELGTWSCEAHTIGGIGASFLVEK